MDTFKRTMKHVEYLVANGSGQTELSLTGVGEAFLNPEFMDMVAYAREHFKGIILFSTNGILMTEEIAERLAELEVYVFVSLHRPEVAAPAINICRRHGILGDTNSSFATSSFNWAGQVDWEVTAAAIECEYLAKGWAAVLQDGSVTTCCMDGEGYNQIGSVYDQLGSLETVPAELCKSCHMIVPECFNEKEIPVAFAW